MIVHLAILHVPHDVHLRIDDCTMPDTLRPEMQKSPLAVRFYQTAAGHEPVREWLRSLTKEQRKAIGEAILETQVGWPVGMPLVRKLERALWEIRANIPPNEIARVIFTVADAPKALLLLHGFVKKSQKTPQHDLETAKHRLKSAP